MVFLEVSAATEPSRSNGDEVDIFSHDIRKLMTIVLSPRVTECLWQLANRLFILLGLRLGEISTCERYKGEQSKRRIHLCSQTHALGRGYAPWTVSRYC